MSDAASVCRLPGCPVSATGKCKRNFDPVDSCPDFGPLETPSDVTVRAESPVEQTVRELIRLPSGDILGLSDLLGLLRAEHPRVIALVGEQEVGKTTLLASIYHIYCRGPFAERRFAGSRTLIAFEKRRHLTLLSSGRTVPTTPRTSRDDPVGFLHLMLKPLEGGSLQHVLISDGSGEAFDAARIDTALIKELVEIRQANRICFLLDGARFLADDQRAGYARRFKQMIRALHDNGVLREGAAVEILTTKIDKLMKPPHSERVIGILADYERNLVRDFGTLGLNISCYRICALPRADYAVGYSGLEDAIRRWTAPLPLPDVRPPPLPDATRQIDRLLCALVSAGLAMTRSNHLVMGLHGSGKTTFAAALWYLVDMGEVDTVLVKGTHVGDFRYLEESLWPGRRAGRLSERRLIASNRFKSTYADPAQRTTLRLSLRTFPVKRMRTPLRDGWLAQSSLSLFSKWMGCSFS